MKTGNPRNSAAGAVSFLPECCSPGHEPMAAFPLQLACVRPAVESEAAIMVSNCGATVVRLGAHRRATKVVTSFETKVVDSAVEAAATMVVSGG